MTKNRGRVCPCGRGRGFPNRRVAAHVRAHMTTLPTTYYQCEHGRTHWH